ncbi:MAG: DUF2341 domain-containing protein [Promethearchaeota archaeon]|jgi:hypothetical protein
MNTIEKIYDKKRKYFFYIFFFLLFNIISIIFLSNSGFDARHSENLTDDPNSLLPIASNGLPNEHFFRYYKVITIDHTMVSGTGSHKNFPFLISIYDSDLHDDVQSNGNDIAFANDTAWLDHEVELFNQSYSSTHAKLIAWVRIFSLSTSIDTNISMYYGNSTMNSQQNPNGVWNTDYKGVWLKDSTINGNDGTAESSMGSVDQGPAQIDGGIDFDGNDDYINAGSGTSIDNLFNGGSTISAWIFPETWGGAHYGRILDKSTATAGDDGWVMCVDGEADSVDHHLLFYRDFSVRRGLWYTPEDSLSLSSWYHIVVTYDDSSTSNTPSIYINGILQSLTPEPTPQGTASDDSAQSLYFANFMGLGRGYSGIIDEIRLSMGIRSSNWIQTEYNNQLNPQSFLTLGVEVSLDYTPPTYSNLIESSDPLELGDTEVITINVSDPSGINQVKIEFTGSNHSMTNIGGETWQYNSWIPSSVNNYTYTIWMEDNYNNWNSTIGTIEVIDTTAPTFSDLIESADPLQFGQNETISIKVYDSPGSGVNQVLFEYDSSNHTMVFISGNTWSWSKWKPVSLGAHPYSIHMEDVENNWNVTSGTINVVSTTAPVLENLTESEDPTELGNSITIGIDVFDNESIVEGVLIELEGVNHTMINKSGFKYEFNWTGLSVGTIYYTIYANDTDSNWNSLTSSFDIVDSTPPVLENLIKSEEPLELGSTVIISINSTDMADINQVLIESDGLNNESMINVGGNVWQYDLWKPSITGNLSYTIWAEDNNNNWASVSDSILVQDTILPSYSNLTVSASIVELGDDLTISINATDLAGIKEVTIEFENSNHTMINLGGDIWEYTTWKPNSIGNYTYNIYITDNNNNLNYTSSSILFQDTTIPIYSNYFENVDPLELGDSPIIKIDVFDFAGINQSLLEFEGANHSMTNIYGDTWQYDSWTPNDWILYQYIIHMEDNSGNWNLFVANITVQDTTPPSAPVLTNSPSGDVNGILVFDWSDGSDPSGIMHYVLIIDSESDPFATPGYIYYFNITNEGPQSSFCQLPETLPLGQYYYFLAQIDGVGLQGSYTVGTFNVVSIENGGTSNNNLIIIIIIILASVIGSASAIVIARKRLKKDIAPPRKKIPLKLISTHINKLSGSQHSLQAAEFIGISSDSTEILTEEEELEIKINEIKNLGEQLFAEGAYLEAQEQFKHGRDLLLHLGRLEEAKLFTELISGIEGLVEEREKRLEMLGQLKIEGNSRQIFDVYQEVIEVSKKLRDPDTTSFYQFELIHYFQYNEFKILELERYRFELEHKADLLFNNNNFEMAAQHYEKCEKISVLLVQLEREKEVSIIEEFRYKKDESLKRVNNQ